MELAYNRRAKFDYEIIDTIDAGLELTGHEVRSAKLGRMKLAGSYVVFQNNEAYILNSAIQAFQPENAPEDFDAERKRKLLLKRKEIDFLRGKKDDGYTIIPIRAFIKRNLIKVTLGIGRGRKKTDKRDVIKKRETDRDIRRTMRRK